jgi:hypothetical protein
MAVLWVILCIAVLVEAGWAGWDLKPPGKPIWGIFWFILAVISLGILLATRDTFVTGF